MGKLEKTIMALTALEGSTNDGHGVRDTRALLLVTLVFLCVTLSLPVLDIANLLLLAIYPVVASPLCGENFSKIFIKSLWVLPLVILIGLFNPIFDHTPLFSVGTVVVTAGWVSFISIILRGLLAMQALLILLAGDGFTGMCRAMERLGMPKFLTVQLLMVFRYMRVLMLELLTMQRARQARGYGRKHLSLKLWGIMMGQLFIRTVDRASRIDRAMRARGFRGTIPQYEPDRRKWGVADTVYMCIWCAMFLLVRFTHIPALLSNIIKWL